MMAAAPILRINPLQRLWLREIGIEKTWLKADEAPRPAAVRPPATTLTQSERALETPETMDLVKAARSLGPAQTARPAQTAKSMEAARSAQTTGATDAVMPTASGAAGPRSPAALSGRPSAQPPVYAKPVRAPAAPAPVAPREADPEFAGRVAQADLAALRDMVSACTACGLCQGRRQPVFGMGAVAPRWMVVGEAPGEQEDRQGLPFVGRSGQLLDAMLAAVGMSRERDVFIANVIKCRPPGNRNPTPEEIAACGPYLTRQIALLKPERILVLGRFAAQTLLNTDAAIGNLRGRVHTVQIDGRDIPVVVSYHPAYLLRSPSEKARSWQDLRRMAGLV